MLYEVITIGKVAPGNERLANIIVEETSRLDAIVREFLDFARPRDVVKKAASLNGVVERLIRFMEPELQARQVQVELALDPDLPEIFFDSRITSYNVCYTKLLRPFSQGASLLKPIESFPLHLPETYRFGLRLSEQGTVISIGDSYNFV